MNITTPVVTAMQKAIKATMIMSVLVGSPSNKSGLKAKKGVIPLKISDRELRNFYELPTGLETKIAMNIQENSRGIDNRIVGEENFVWGTTGTFDNEYGTKDVANFTCISVLLCPYFSTFSA